MTIFIIDASFEYSLEQLQKFNPRVWTPRYDAAANAFGIRHLNS